MEILNQEVRDATKKKFDEEMVNKTTIVYFSQEPGRLITPDYLKGQECLFCRETRKLLEEVVALSDKIDLIVYDFVADKERAAGFGVDKIPAIVVTGGGNPGIKFYGIPSGYEYTSLVEAITDVSKGKTSLSKKTIDVLKTLNKDVHIQVFVTPTCPYCTIPVRLGHQFALESPLVKAEMVEATEFPHLVQKYSVFSVPKTVINETVMIDGAVAEESFLESVLNALSMVNP